MTVLMILRLLAITLLLPVGGLLSGCACPSSKCGVPGTPSAPCALETVIPEDIPPNLDAVEGYDLIPLPTPTETYQLLEASICQCNAVTNADVANMIELERHWGRVVMECDSDNVAENIRLDRDLLALRSVDLRNDSAAQALTAFYQLAGLEAQKHYLQLGLLESEKTLKRIDKLKAEGLSIPKEIEESEIASKVKQLQDQSLQLDFSRIQLNGQIQTLIGCPLSEYCFYWPQLDWQPDLTPLDIEAELAEGLANRIDLRGLGLVLCKMTKTTLPIARGVLKFSDSTVGSIEPREGWIHVARCFRCNEHEVPVRCRQLALFYSHSERGATAEIKGAAYNIRLLQQQVVVAQEKVHMLQERLEEINKTRDLKDIGVFQISSVRGSLYEAQSELIERVVALKIGRVKLYQAQDMLPMQCGFNPRLCCEGCCDGDCCHCQKRKCGKCKSTKCCCQKSKDCCN